MPEKFKIKKEEFAALQDHSLLGHVKSMKDKTLWRCPNPRSLFEKSDAKTLKFYV